MATQLYHPRGLLLLSSAPIRYYHQQHSADVRLFNNVVNSLGYIASDGRMIGQ
jgi:hypothetical protein